MPSLPRASKRTTCACSVTTLAFWFAANTASPKTVVALKSCFLLIRTSVSLWRDDASRPENCSYPEWFQIWLLVRGRAGYADGIEYGDVGDRSGPQHTAIGHAQPCRRFR